MVHLRAYHLELGVEGLDLRMGSYDAGIEVQELQPAQGGGPRECDISLQGPSAGEEAGRERGRGQAR